MIVDLSPKLRTPGVLAAELGEPLHRILYILRSRPHIRPTARAGRLRLYDREAVALVRYELNTIDARQAGLPQSECISRDAADHALMPERHPEMSTRDTSTKRSHLDSHGRRHMPSNDAESGKESE